MKVSVVSVVLAVSSLTAQLRAEGAASPSSGNPTAAAPADPFIKKDAVVPADETGPVSNWLLTLEVYHLSQSDGAKLIQENDADQARHDRVLDWVKDGKAHFDAVLCGALKSGQQAVVEQINVFSYPISFSYVVGKGGMATDFKSRNLGYRLVVKGQSTPDKKGFNTAMFFEDCRLKGFSENLPYGVGLAEFDSRRVNAVPPYFPCEEIRFLGTYSPAPQDSAWSKSPQPKNQADESEMTLVFGKVSPVLLVRGTPTTNSLGSLEQQFSLYSMDREAARQILSQKQEMDSAYQAVLALVKANQAKLEHLSVLRTNSGVKSNFDEITEFTYPTGAANQFISQDVGLSGEVKTVFDGHTSLLTIDVTKSQLLSYLENLPVVGVGAAASQAQPLFGIQSVVTTINSGLGEHELLGTFSPAGDTGVPGQKDTGRVWLEFIQTTAVNP